MPRREQPLESGDDVLRQFASDLRQLREKAGSPTYRQLSARAYYSAAALSEAANGRQLPSLAVTLAYVAACEGDPAAWEARWKEIATGIAHDPIHGNSDDAPYVGLGAFQIGDAHRFFGRDKLITDLQTRVRERRFLGVFGASGSGKSSVLRAGLTARLTAAGHPAVVFTPGPHPIEECAVHLAAVLGTSPAVLRAELAADPSHLHLRIRQALADRPADVDLLLVVDQFEELFTLCADRDERQWWIDALTTAAFSNTSRTRVVLGVRADFYGHCGQFPQLVDALRDAQVLVGQMDEVDLQLAITEPAVRAGLRVETALVSKLIAATAYQVGDLPLLSHVLLETWRRRRGTTLTLAGYVESGGIAHAVWRTAEEIYTALDGGQQTIAKQIFLRLTALGEGTEGTKRRIDRGELDNNDPNTGVVLENLAQARLITLDRDSVEIAHEALIRHWPRLRDWLTEDRDGLRIYRQLTDATAIWYSLHRDPSALYRGTRLALAEGWAATNDTALTPREHEFLSHSLSAQAHDQTAVRRRARRLRQLVALLTVLLLLATATTVFAIRAQQTATEQRTAALAQKVLREATAIRAINPPLARQLALAAYRLDPTKAARDTLHEVAGSPYSTVLPDHPSSVFDVAVSHDGRILATATLGLPSSSRLHDISDPRRPRDLPDLPATFTAVAFSPRAPILATVNGGTVRLWDLTDPHRVRELANVGGSAVFPGLGSSVAFGPDGQLLATADSQRSVRLWDVADPRNPTLLSALPRGSDIGRTPGIGASVAFNPDGQILAVTARDRTARLWDLTNPRDPQPLGVLSGHTDAVMAVTFSPDGKVMATASQDATIRLWNVADPRRPVLLAQLTGHSGPVLAAAFSRDGSTLATASDDRTTRLWNVADPGKPSELTTLTGHTDTVFGMAFSPDGRTLVTGSGDRTVRLEDISALVLTSHADSLFTIAASPADNLVATSSGDRTIRLWDFADLNRIKALATLHPEAEAQSLSFSSDGHLLVAVVETTVRLWDITDPSKPQELTIRQPNADELPRAGFSPTGRVLAMATDTMGTGFNERMQLLDASDPNNLRTVGHLPAMFVAFSPDGRVLTSSSEQGKLQLWNITDPNNPRIELSMKADAESVTFSPNGHLLAAGKVLDNTMRLWDIANPQRVEEVATIPVGDASGPVTAFSPDGSRLVTSGADRTARVWNISDPRHPIEETTLRGHAAEVRAATFIPGTNTLATADEDHVIRLWETDIERLADQVCDIAYPRITRTEWDQHFPGLRFQPPCP